MLNWNFSPCTNSAHSHTHTWREEQREWDKISLTWSYHARQYTRAGRLQLKAHLKLIAVQQRVRKRKSFRQLGRTVARIIVYARTRIFLCVCCARVRARACVRRNLSGQKWSINHILLLNLSLLFYLHICVTHTHIHTQAWSSFTPAWLPAPPQPSPPLSSPAL